MNKESDYSLSACPLNPIYPRILNSWRCVLLACCLCVLGLTGCQSSKPPTSKAEPVVSAEIVGTPKPNLSPARFNLVVLVVNGLYEIPLHLRPSALGGQGEACPQLAALLAGGLRINELAPSPTHVDTVAWLHAASQGAQVCALFGTAVDPGVAAGADWWVGQSHSAGGLPVRDREIPTRYASHFPVRRLGMTAAVAQPMSRPWLLQISDEFENFMLFQARAAAPFSAVVELNVSNTQLQAPDATSLRQWQTNRSQADAIALARLDMADNVVSNIQSQLVWFEEVPRTLWVIVANDGPPGTSPLLVLHWPESLSAGELSAHEANLQTLQQSLANLMAGHPIKSGAWPAALEQALNDGLRRAQQVAEENP